MLSIPKFLDEMQVPVNKMTITQLREREELWRILWSWLDEDVKNFLYRIGTTVRIMKRNYQGTVGELGQVKFEPKEIEIVVYEKTYNYNDGQHYFERKVVKFPWAAVAWFEGINESQLASEVDLPEVEGIPESESV